MEAILTHWDFPTPLAEFGLLFGGYSGTSIRVVGGDGQRFVLKICHGYTRADVEEQARCAAYLRAHGCSGACTAIPLRP